MTQISARYYYVPICTESFASLDRLRDFFSNISNRIKFDAINIFNDEIKVDESFKNNELKFLQPSSFSVWKIIY